MTRLRPLAAALALLALCACASAPPRADAPEGTVPVGVARVDITPAEPIRLTGYGDRRVPTDSVAGRLWAKAIALGGDGDGPAVLLTADLIGVPAAVTERVARRLEGAGVARERLAVTATHTHTGPSLTGVLPGIFAQPLTAAERAAIDRYTEGLVAKLEEVARAALADRRPARLAWGEGRAGFAANRRVLRDGRWVGFGINPDGPVDHALPVLRVTDPEGRLRAVLLGYASHCTTLEGKHNFIHGDWAGAAQQAIEERHPGALALVTIGAGADANPSPRGGGLADVQRHGREIADEVDRLLATPLRPLRAAPEGRFRRLDLAFQDSAGTPLGSAPYPVQSWSFGPELAMVFLGGEVVADYGLRLKRELGPSRLWVTAYANDVAFYVASRRMLAEGGYEVDRSMAYYGQPGRLAEGTEERIVRAVHELLARP